MGIVVSNWSGSVWSAGPGLILLIPFACFRSSCRYLHSLASPALPVDKRFTWDVIGIFRRIKMAINALRFQGMHNQSATVGVLHVLTVRSFRQVFRIDAARSVATVHQIPRPSSISKKKCNMMGQFIRVLSVNLYRSCAVSERI